MLLFNQLIPCPYRIGGLKKSRHRLFRAKRKRSFKQGGYSAHARTTQRHCRTNERAVEVGSLRRNQRRIGPRWTKQRQIHSRRETGNRIAREDRKRLTRRWFSRELALRRIRSVQRVNCAIRRTPATSRPSPRVLQHQDRDG
ncbi:MAG: hypothetical protein JWL80_579 [Parcubacteria group bacterium]|nr:hypothetical protein [Parcubacteria group bacterium]